MKNFIINKYWQADTLVQSNTTKILINGSVRQWITVNKYIKIKEILRKYPNASDVMYMAGEEYTIYYTINKA